MNQSMNDPLGTRELLGAFPPEVEKMFFKEEQAVEQWYKSAQLALYEEYLKRLEVIKNKRHEWLRTNPTKQDSSTD